MYDLRKVHSLTLASGHHDDNCLRTVDTNSDTDTPSVGPMIVTDAKDLPSGAYDLATLDGKHTLLTLIV